MGRSFEVVFPEVQEVHGQSVADQDDGQRGKEAKQKIWDACNTVVFELWEYPPLE